jgi:hypothetical protein
VAQSSTAILNIKDFFQECILHNLKYFYTWITANTEQRSLDMSIIRSALHLASSLFEHDNWSMSVANARKDGLAILLYSQPETLAKCLTDILNLRNATSVPQGFRLQDWEHALLLVEKLSDVATCSISSLDEFPKFNAYLASLENNGKETPPRICHVAKKKKMNRIFFL